MSGRKLVRSCECGRQFHDLSREGCPYCRWIYSRVVTPGHELTIALQRDPGVDTTARERQYRYRRRNGL
jgi:hypothetical protein